MVELPSFMASHGERLIENGYSIIPIMPGMKIPGQYIGGEWRAYKDWSRHCERATKPFEFDIWRRWPNCAVGLACGSVIGVDIDVLSSPEVAHDLEALARQMLGDTPAIRIGNAPKRALFYRAASPFRGRKLHPVEVYGLGAQMVAYGIHPDTARPYEWPDESLLEIDISRLPEITEAKAMAWLEEAYRRVPDDLKPKRLHDAEGSVSTWRGPSDPRGTYEAVQSALAMLPNNDVSGTEWVFMLNAIKGALGEEGRDLWLDWSAQSAKSGASGKSDTAERRWKTAKPLKTGAGSIYWLAEQRGWTPAANLILNGAAAASAQAIHPAAALIAKAAALAAQERGPAPPEAAPVATDIMQLTGTLKLLVDWFALSAFRPQPFLDLAAALTCVGTVAGRKYRTVTNLRTNLYAIGIGDSGSGKDNGLKCVREALFAAGLSDYLGGELVSGAGMLSTLQLHPCRLFLADEIGKLLQVVNAKGAPSHKAEILTNFTKLFTSAGTIYLGAEYADKTTKRRIDIYDPCCSLYGVTVPGTFWSALQSGAMNDGSLARCLVFLSANDYPERNRQQEAVTAPQEVIDALLAIAAGHGGGGDRGNLEMLATARPDPYTVPETAEASAEMERLRDEETDWLRQAKGTPNSAIIARYCENTIKIALVSAISNNPASPVIGLRDVQWSAKLVEHCVSTMIRQSERLVADTPREANLKWVLDIIRRHDGAISQRDLTRKIQKLQRRDRDEIVDSLIESGDIIMVVDKKPGGGPPCKTYTALTQNEASTRLANV